MLTHKHSLRSLLLILLLATATRLYHLQTQSIWFDEGWSAYAAVQPALLDAINADTTNPPLYYLLLNISTKFLGDSEFSLRFFSLAFGLIGIALAYRLGRFLFDARSGVFGALLLAVSPLMWWASQEARMYTLLAVLVLITTLGWHGVLARPSLRAWLMLWGGELALLYAHNTGPVIVLWLNAAVLAARFFTPFLRSLRTGGIYLAPTNVHPHEFKKRINLRIWFAGQIGVGLLWMPYFVGRFLLIQEANSALVTPPEFSLTLVWQLWEALWAGVWMMVGREPLITFFAVLLLVVAIATFRWRSANARWLLLHTLLLTGGLLLGLTVLGNHIHARYMVMIAPLPLVAIGAGLARLPVWRTRAFNLPFIAPRYLAAVGFAAVLPFSMALLAQTPGYQHDDARNMVQWYADNLTAEDAVLAWSYADRYDLWYYWERLGVTARRVTLPEGADLDQITPLLPSTGRVAVNVWYTQRADYRGMLDCVLRHGTYSWETTPEATFNGMTTRVYPANRQPLPEMQPFDGRFENGRLTAVGQLPTDFTADQYACLPLQFVPSQDVAGELEVNITIQHPSGWNIGSRGAIFATANQRTAVAIGETLNAYVLFLIGVGNPPQSYPVYARIYEQVIAISGYDVLNEAGRPIGKDLQISLWQVVPGAIYMPEPLSCVDSQSEHDELRQLGPLRQKGDYHNGENFLGGVDWLGCAPIPDFVLEAEDGSWRVELPSTIGAHDYYTRDLRAVNIPVEAQSGRATLRTSDGEPIYTINILHRPLIFDPPPYTVAVNTPFPDVGTLVGYTIETETLDHTQPATITLVWQAGEATPTTDYIVFVQLLNQDGVLIAQSDAQPAQNTRPTTTWVTGEYIIDTHPLTFNGRAAAGEVTLIAGLYTPNGVRLQFPSGEDFVILAEGLMLR